MYGIFTYIYHKNQPNVGKYTIHGSYGLYYFPDESEANGPTTTVQQPDSTTTPTETTKNSPRIFFDAEAISILCLFDTDPRTLNLGKFMIYHCYRATKKQTKTTTCLCVSVS